MIRRPLVIVGAGPAGMAAAIAAAEAGVRATVIDENAQAGGQIYHQSPPKLKLRTTARSATKRRGNSLLRRFRECGGRIEFLSEACVWGVFPPRRLAVSQESGWDMIDADHLLLAPGAHEYVPPFPGWTLPGVMTPGAAQRLVKAMQIVPGQRILLAGSGPFLLVVAEYLHRAGANVLGIVEAVRGRTMLRHARGLLAHFGLLWEGVGHLVRMKRAGIPIYSGHLLVEARGDREVREAVIAPCDEEWTPDYLRTRTIAVDTICVGYGFVPRVQLAQLAGCRLRFVDIQGGWVPEVDGNLQTSVEGIYSAGDGGGIAGAIVAELEGRLAGLGIARRLGALSEGAFRRSRAPILNELARLRRFRAALDIVGRLRVGLTALAKKDTLVCRCEELTLGEIEEGIAAGGVNLRTIKPMTRLAMGPCQGQVCWPAMSRLLACRTGQTPDQVGPLSVRPPLRPMCLADLAAPALNNVSA